MAAVRATGIHKHNENAAYDKGTQHTAATGLTKWTSGQPVSWSAGRSVLLLGRRRSTLYCFRSAFERRRRSTNLLLPAPVVRLSCCPTTCALAASTVTRRQQLNQHRRDPDLANTACDAESRPYTLYEMLALALVLV